MIFKKSHFPLVNIPDSVGFTLYLILADLKSMKFFNGLAKVGLDDCFYRSDFSTLVLYSLDFCNPPDEIFQFYFNLIEEHSERIEADNDSVMTEALHVYTELMIEKKKLQKD